MGIDAARILTGVHMLVIATQTHAQRVTGQRHGPVMSMALDPGVLHTDSFAKYAAGGVQLPFDYDPAHDLLVAGQPKAYFISLFNGGIIFHNGFE